MELILYSSHMRSKILMSLAIPTLATGFFIPQVFAGELGSAFQKTFEASQFTYKATADMTLEKNIEADMPFTLRFQGQEVGGKKSDNYGEKGSFSFRVSDLSDLPPELSDMSFVDFSAGYRADYQDPSQTAYLLLDSLKVNTDGKEARVFTDMINELGKIYTGKAFKFSSKELMDVLSNRMAGFMSPEDLMAFNVLGDNSVKTMVEAFGKALDGLVDSGVLVDQVSNDGSRRLRGSMGGQVHTLTLADSITSSQAEMLRGTLVTFVESLLPALASDMNADLQYLPIEEMTRQINEALAAFKGTELVAEVGVESGMMQSLSFVADLSGIQVPLKMNMNVDLDYSSGFDMVVPRNPENVVDLNKVVEGFVQIFGLGTTSSFIAPSYDESWSEETNYYLVLDTIDVIADYVWNTCGEDKKCRRNTLNQLKRDLRQLKNDGYIYPQEYQWKLIELNSLR